MVVKLVETKPIPEFERILGDKIFRGGLLSGNTVSMLYQLIYEKTGWVARSSPAWRSHEICMCFLQAIMVGKDLDKLPLQLVMGSTEGTIDIQP